MQDCFVPPQSGVPRNDNLLNYPRLEGEGSFLTVDLKSTLPVRFFLFVIPAEAGIQDLSGFRVAFHLPGMTTPMLGSHMLMVGSFQCSRSTRTLESRTDHFAKLASPQGEGFPPSPKGTLIANPQSTTINPIATPSSPTERRSSSSPHPSPLRRWLCIEWRRILTHRPCIEGFD